MGECTTPQATHGATHICTATNTSLIQSRNGVVSDCLYAYGGSSDLVTYITQLQTLQELVLMAYTGVVNRLYDLDLIASVARMSTEHARHSAYTRGLLYKYNAGDARTPFPSAFDNSRTPVEMLAVLIATYGLFCDDAIVVVPPVGSITGDMTNTTSATGEHMSTGMAATQAPTDMSTQAPSDHDMPSTPTDMSATQA